MHHLIIYFSKNKYSLFIYLAPLGVLTNAWSLEKRGFEKHTKRSSQRGSSMAWWQGTLKKLLFVFYTTEEKNLFSGEWIKDCRYYSSRKFNVRQMPRKLHHVYYIILYWWKIKTKWEIQTGILVTILKFNFFCISGFFLISRVNVFILKENLLFLQLPDHRQQRLKHCWDG